jgi:hypothetical protein
VGRVAGAVKPSSWQTCDVRVVFGMAIGVEFVAAAKWLIVANQTATPSSREGTCCQF